MGEGLVQHFTTAVFIVARMEGAKRVLFIKHRKLGVWMPPGGHVDSEGEAAELPHGCALREVREETGLEVEFAGSRAKEFREYSRALAEVTRSQQIPSPHHMNLEHIGPGHNHIDFIYFAKSMHPEEAKHDSRESDGLKWMSESEISEEVSRGELWPEVAYFASLALAEVELEAEP